MESRATNSAVASKLSQEGVVQRSFVSRSVSRARCSSPSSSASARRARAARLRRRSRRRRGVRARRGLRRAPVPARPGVRGLTRSRGGNRRAPAGFPTRRASRNPRGRERGIAAPSQGSSAAAASRRRSRPPPRIVHNADTGEVEPQLPLRLERGRFAGIDPGLPRLTVDADLGPCRRAPVRPPRRGRRRASPARCAVRLQGPEPVDLGGRRRVEVGGLFPRRGGLAFQLDRLPGVLAGGVERRGGCSLHRSGVTDAAARAARRQPCPGRHLLRARDSRASRRRGRTGAQRQPRRGDGPGPDRRPLARSGKEPRARVVPRSRPGFPTAAYPA